MRLIKEYLKFAPADAGLTLHFFNYCIMGFRQLKSPSHCAEVQVSRVTCASHTSSGPDRRPVRRASWRRERSYQTTRPTRRSYAAVSR